MTNEELKKKIKEILRKRMTELLGSCHTDEIPLTEEGAEAILFYADEFADALIAAGIGDVSKLKNHRVIAEYSLVPDDDNPYIIPNVPLRVTQHYSGEEVEKMAKERKELKDELRSKVEYIHEQDEVIKEYKHRAARAERALDLCETAYILSLNHRATEGVSGQAIASDLGIHKFFMEQAEKELAEEAK